MRTLLIIITVALFGFLFGCAVAVPSKGAAPPVVNTPGEAVESIRYDSSEVFVVSRETDHPERWHYRIMTRGGRVYSHVVVAGSQGETSQ